jgi:regulator of replication initiation timing
MESSDVEELRREVARLSVEVDMLKSKMRICLEIAARIREELEHMKRKTRKSSIKQYIEALKTYEEGGAGEPEPP